MATMQTSAEKAALSAFIDAAIDDFDSGYPNGVAFVPWQETPQTSRTLWRYLQEGRPAVIIGTEDFDMLIVPISTGRLARLRNELLRQVTVEISCHRKNSPPPTETLPLRANVGEHVLSAEP